MHEVLVNRLGGLSLPRKSAVRLTDRPDMTLDVYRGCKNNNTTYNNNILLTNNFIFFYNWVQNFIAYISEIPSYYHVHFVKKKILKNCTKLLWKQAVV